MSSRPSRNRSSALLSILFGWLFLAGLVSPPLHGSIPRDRHPTVELPALIEGPPAAERVASAFPPARLELGLSEGDAAILRRVLVRQNPWSSFDPEGLFLFGLFDSAGDYGHEVGEVFKGYGDVTVGALVATARAIVELPRNTIGVVNDLAEMSQMDSAHVAQGVENAASKEFQDAKQAASDYGDRLANGDNRAWGQVIGTVLTFGGAKGANFAKAAEVVEASEAGTAAARAAEAAAELAKKSGSCFPAGTLVATPDGSVPIEEIKEGDEVLAYDFDLQLVVQRKVVKTHPHFTYCWVDVLAGGEKITATRGHLFWVESTQQWIAAIQLQPGMTVRLADGHSAGILAVSVRELDQPERTFNFEVHTDHDYFVGASKVLVHNGNSDGHPSNRQIRKNWEKAEGATWPTDPATGQNQHVSHEIPKSKGGSSELSNIKPRTAADHIQKHKDAGDYKEWGAQGAKAAKAAKTAKKARGC